MDSDQFFEKTVNEMKTHGFSDAEIKLVLGLAEKFAGYSDNVFMATMSSMMLACEIRDEPSAASAIRLAVMMFCEQKKEEIGGDN